MHSSPTLTTPTVPFLVQAGFCATGLVLGLLTYHTFSHPAAELPPSPEERITQPVAPSARPPAGARPGLPLTATASLPVTGDPSGGLATVREILGSNRSEVQKMAKLAAWAERASEAELKMALERPEIPLIHLGPELLDHIVLSRLAEIDGETALQVVGQLEKSGNRRFDADAVGALFESWASWDPQGAARGALTLMQGDSERFAPAVKSVLENISREFPLYARDLASQLARSADETIREVGYEAHADLLRRHLERGNDCASAVAWIDTTQVSAEERQFLLGALVTERLDGDHTADALQAFRQLDATANRELTMRVIRALADTQPQASRDIALALPAGELREQATSTLTRILLKRESPESVLDWLGTQAAHADFDQAFTQLAEAFDESDPQAAWRCAARVSSEAEGRSNLACEFGFKWLKADFAQASRELPADLVQKYHRTEALLRELKEVFSESNDEVTINFRPAKQHDR